MLYGWRRCVQTCKDGTSILDNIVFTAFSRVLVIELPSVWAHPSGMIRTAHIFAATLSAALIAGAAQAACQVEYKAKQDNPLKLYHDVTTVDAPCQSAEAALRAQLAARGLTLLKVLSKRDT